MGKDTQIAITPVVVPKLKKSASLPMHTSLAMCTPGAFTTNNIGSAILLQSLHGHVDLSSVSAYASIDGGATEILPFMPITPEGGVAMLHSLPMRSLSYWFATPYCTAAPISL